MIEDRGDATSHLAPVKFLPLRHKERLQRGYAVRSISDLVNFYRGVFNTAHDVLLESSLYAATVR
jgi:hypothetical protein